MPHAPGETIPARFAAALTRFFRQPLRSLRAFFVSDWAKRTMILLYMRTVDGYLTLRKGRVLGAVRSEPGSGPPARAWIPEATELAEKVAIRLDGYPQSMLTETIFGIPTTAPIRGGCSVGADAASGVIDARHRVHGYDGLWVIDGSAMSANPGVNPSLTITALAERAMSFIPAQAIDGEHAQRKAKTAAGDSTASAS